MTTITYDETTGHYITDDGVTVSADANSAIDSFETEARQSYSYSIDMVFTNEANTSDKGIYYMDAEQVEFSNDYSLSMSWNGTAHFSNQTYTLSWHSMTIGNDLDNVIYGNGDTLFNESGQIVDEREPNSWYHTFDGGNDEIYAGLGDDTVYGLGGDDILYGEDGNDTLYGGTGDDLLVGGDGNDVLFGEDGNDTIDAGEGDDTIDGGDGNDTIAAGEGNDTIDGGSGDDTIDAGAGDDRIYISAGTDTIDGGEGTDTFSVETADSGVTVVLENASTGNNGWYSVEASGDGGTLTGIEDVTGSDYDDTLFGNDDANILQGGAGDDVIDGLDGDDIIDGGAGSDAIDGSYGIDTLVFADTEGGVVVDLSADTVSDDGFGFEDMVYNFENVTGTDYADDISGDSGDNVIDAGGGDDIVRVSGGNDTLDGGDGVDDLNFSNAESDVTVDLSVGTIEDNGFGGQDAIANFENVYGSDYDDTITGDGGDNTLYGADGNDTINGGDGNDILVGGDGDDFLFGGDGDDILVSTGGTDVLTGGEGADTFIIANDSVTITDFNADEGDTILVYSLDAGSYAAETDTDNGFYFSTGLSDSYLALENTTYADFRADYYWLPPTVQEHFDIGTLDDMF